MTAVDDDLVVLLDESGRAVGTAPRATVHGPATPLHRAFSCYLFGSDGRLLLTRRASTKTAFPGVWTNSVCGHPRPGEADVDAVRRRAEDELGLDVRDLVLALPDFRYRASSGGVVENEICPVYLGTAVGAPAARPEEVDEHRWSTWSDFLRDLAAAPDDWSPWSVLQAAQLEAAVTARLGGTA